MAVRTGTSRRLAARKQAAPQPAAARDGRRLPSLRTAIIASAAYVVAVIFVLPYLEMLITAVRPQRELYAPTTCRTTSPGRTSPICGAPRSASRRPCG